MKRLASEGDGSQLSADWRFASVPAGTAVTPEQLASANAHWSIAQVPGTVAASLRTQGTLVELNQQQFVIDQLDHWYQCCIDLPQTEWLSLCFEGLATVAQVFWNDGLILTANNMFLSYEVDMSDLPRSGTLAIRFPSLSVDLETKRPRPRWRTRLVEQQQLRWIRTTLMGRIPGWSATGAPVGPYRAIKVRTSNDFIVVASTLAPELSGENGRLRPKIHLRLPNGFLPSSATICVADQIAPLVVEALPDGTYELSGDLSVSSPKKWWPHSHGEPTLYSVSLEIRSETQAVTLKLGSVGFRQLKVDQTDSAFQIRINDVPIFCRGACWTPVDVLTLNANEAELRSTLEMVRDAGMNMVRVGGTMVYESDDFYQLCDEFGILVWQDFMFANMDYPVSDEAFALNIATEAKQFLARVQSRPSLSVLCGGSEIEQQAAMLGLPPEHWRNEFFGKTLAKLCAEYCPEVTYVPSSPSGGAMPFQVDHSISHYYGVGAYLRPLDDARRAGVRFTSESLGFSNVPEQETVESLLGNGQQPFHHPVWKQRVPRDSGAGWDFEDVRDHYLADLFKVDPMRLRYADMARYLYMSRVVTGEVMACAMSEWRRDKSSCDGALVWFLRDLWPGAGWGVIDAHGLPKAAYYALKRVSAPRAVVISDEGLNGLVLHVFNDGPEVLNGHLNLRLLRHGEIQVASSQHMICVPGHGSIEIRADAMFEHFVDTSYAYRFGPAGHHVAVADLCETTSGDSIGQAFHFPLGLEREAALDLGLKASFFKATDGSWSVNLSTHRLAQFVHLSIPGCHPIDNYFHLSPGNPRKVELRGQFKSGSPRGTVTALNWDGSEKIGIAA